MLKKILEYIKYYIRTYILSNEQKQTDNTSIENLNGIPFDENRKVVNVGITMFNNSWIDTNYLTDLYKWLFDAYNINVNIDIFQPDTLLSINNDTYEIIIIIMGDKNNIFTKQKAEKRLLNIKDILSKIIRIQEIKIIEDVIPYANIMIHCARDYNVSDEKFNNLSSLNDVSLGERLRLQAIKANNEIAEKMFHYIVEQLETKVQSGKSFLRFTIGSGYCFTQQTNDKLLTWEININNFRGIYDRLINEGFFVYFIKEGSYKWMFKISLLIAIEEQRIIKTETTELIPITNYEKLIEIHNKIKRCE